MAKFILNLDGPSIKIPTKLAESSFDYASRHQIIAEIIERYFKDKKPKNILDVGGLGSPLQQMVKSPITILDEEAEDNDPGKEKGDGADMRLADGSFDAVVTSDTLEHIPQNDRENFIKELVRVSDDLVILCAPFARLSVAEEEQKLQDYYVSLTGKEHRWLMEHKDYGLPRLDEILGYFKKAGVSTTVFHHTSLDIWRQLMGINLVSNEMGFPLVHDKATKLNKQYNKEVLFNDFTDNGYRTFILASKSKDITFQHPKPAGSYSPEFTKALGEFYESALVEAEYVPKLRKKVKDLHDEKMRLATEVEELRVKYNRTLNGRVRGTLGSAKRATKLRNKEIKKVN